MSKDKIIKDLKERNDKLKNQYQLQEIRLHSLEYEKEKLELEKDKEINRLNNIINRTIKYVESLSSSGRGCDIYEDIKKEILNELKGDNK